MTVLKAPSCHKTKMLLVLITVVLLHVGEIYCKRHRYPVVVPRGYKKPDSQYYFIGKRAQVDQMEVFCNNELDCPTNYCCAYKDEETSKFVFPQVRPRPICQPMGTNGDMCFSHTPNSVGIGCGCAPDYQCMNFVGYSFGICAAVKK